MHLVSPVSTKQSLQEGLRNKVAYLSCQWTAHFFPLTVAARSLPSLQTLLCLPLYLLNGTLFDQPHLHSNIHLLALIYSTPQKRTFTLIISQSPICWTLFMPAVVNEEPYKWLTWDKFFIWIEYELSFSYSVHIINLSNVSWLTEVWL